MPLFAIHSLELLILLALRTTKPGAARQPLTFLASPRKVSKRRRPQLPSPLRGARHRAASIGTDANSLRSDKHRSFSDCCNTVPATPHAEFPNRSLRIALTNARKFRLGIHARKHSEKSHNKYRRTPPYQGNAKRAGERIPHVESPLMRCGNRKKRSACLSEASCALLPIDVVQRREPRRGDVNCGRLLLLTFLGEARKVSGCRATPG